ncbi:PepSY domain-containing protein [Paenibacillus sp. 19GGS1-52]|uniref:PepSY-associated TM helix domain-containing protein n=1 Tax=Paenibacillus sp. 19GGS1-52 TaxID=2758563 RepID=UPI001EFAB13B|nr:PepSY-associated TM helix domain-containing protein [Paenibacillus sp. 19GGS1-52]ULO05550.1 PepSY domain-containing protein [Paenibacillus sp. 19GGS1-52]
MKRNRQIHLWVGLICSVFILLQSVTGLLLLEPWIIGGGEGGRGEMSAAPTASTDGTAGAAGANASTAVAAAGSTTTANAPDVAVSGRGAFGDRGGMDGGGGAVSFIKNLHEGRIGNTDISWILDLAAIGMIILTVTGIILSVKVLKSQQIRRKKLRAAA